MTDYTVNQNFVAFDRQYRRGTRLTADDRTCWLPTEAADAKVAQLVHDCVLTEIPAETASPPAPAAEGGE